MAMKFTVLIAFWECHLHDQSVRANELKSGTQTFFTCNVNCKTQAGVCRNTCTINLAANAGNTSTPVAVIEQSMLSQLHESAIGMQSGVFLASAIVSRRN